MPDLCCDPSRVRRKQPTPLRTIVFQAKGEPASGEAGVACVSLGGHEEKRGGRPTRRGGRGTQRATGEGPRSDSRRRGQGTPARGTPGPVADRGGPVRTPGRRRPQYTQG